jgi:hypothetical protein
LAPPLSARRASLAKTFAMELIMSLTQPGPNYILDSNIFDRVCDGKVVLPKIVPGRLTAVGVQLAEIRAIPDANAERREKLLNIFQTLIPEVALTSSACFGIEGAGWGQARWNDGDGLFERMLERLRELDAHHLRGKQKKPSNQVRDICLAESAIKYQSILVSDDKNLRQVVQEFGGLAINSCEFAMAARIP